MEYDYIIVGAGAAGLHCALRLLQSNKSLKVLILERYNYIGGRIVTYHKELPDGTDLQWENGAGRIHDSHKLVKKYIKKYGLHTHPLNGEHFYQSRDGAPLEQNRFQEMVAAFLAPLQDLPATTLRSNTLEQLSRLVHGKPATTEFFKQFPYRAEVTTMRADVALDSFLNVGGVAGSGFSVVQDGLGAMIMGMAGDFVKEGGTILMGQTVKHVRSLGSKNHEIETQDDNGRKLHFTARKVIMALHCKALKGIPECANWPVLKHVVMRPLLRVYAHWNSNWMKFLEGKRVVFGNNPLRHFIPTGSTTAMISYTDADDTATWMRDAWDNPKGLERRMMKALREAFPNKEIPDPVFFKAHPWQEGCSYWTPCAGPEDLTKISLEISPGVYACGESFSADKQCWIEGALESAEKLLHTLRY
jgi:predicted NAD/FAD-dependent oxidoreductase